MKKTGILVAALIVTILANAQLHEKIVVKAGENVAEAVSPNGFYRFPKFTEGTFTLKNGSKASAMFNFHIGNGEIEYLGDKGDTMAIGVPDDIANVTIGESTFIYNNKTVIEILAGKEPAKLARRVRIILENEKKGGYGESAPASSQANFKNFNFATGMFQLTHDIAIIKTTSYYWADDRNNLTAATKKNSLKLVSKDKQPKLEAFIEENKTNFNKEDDLRRLVTFAGSL